MESNLEFIKLYESLSELNEAGLEQVSLFDDVDEYDIKFNSKDDPDYSKILAILKQSVDSFNRYFSQYDINFELKKGSDYIRFSIIAATNNTDFIKRLSNWVDYETKIKKFNFDTNSSVEEALKQYFAPSITKIKQNNFNVEVTTTVLDNQIKLSYTFRKNVPTDNTENNNLIEILSNTNGLINFIENIKDGDLLEKGPIEKLFIDLGLLDKLNKAKKSNEFFTDYITALQYLLNATSQENALVNANLDFGLQPRTYFGTLLSASALDSNPDFIFESQVNDGLAKKITIDAKLYKGSPKLTNKTHNANFLLGFVWDKNQWWVANQADKYTWVPYSKSPLAYNFNLDITFPMVFLRHFNKDYIKVEKIIVGS